MLNNSSIEIGDTKSIIGGGPGLIDFVDVSTGKIKSLEFSENAPKWRKVSKGLNIFGICNNPKCEAFKKEVVYPLKLNKILKFSLKDEILSIKYPICNKIIKPKTCGFWKCEYQFVGTTLKEGNVNNYESKPKETKNNDFEYFDPFENGEVEWVDLVIFVLPKQTIKYKEN